MGSARTKIPLTKKILYIFLTVSILIILLGALNLRNIWRYEESTGFIKDTTLQELILISHIDHNACNRKLSLIYFMFSEDSIQKQLHKDRIKELNLENENSLDSLSSIATDKMIIDHLIIVRQKRQEYLEKAEEALVLFNSGNVLSPIEYEKNELRPLFDHYINSIKDLSAAIVSVAEKDINETMAEVYFTRNIVYAIIAIALLILLFFGGTLSGIIKKLRNDYALLQQSQEQLKKQYEQVEEAVKERTADLKFANEQLLKFNTIIGMSENPVVITDLNDRIKYWNKGAETVFGFREDEAMGEICPEMLEKDFGKPYTEIKAELFRTGEFSGDFICKTAEGETKNMFSSLTLFRNEEGKPDTILEIAQDFTERKEMEQDIKKYNQELQEINDAKDKIISVISHDLRNPVAGLISSSQLLHDNLESFEKPDITKITGIINNTSKKLLQQLDELVNWAKEQHLKAVYNPCLEKLCKAVAKALSIVRVNALQKEITLENKVPEDLFVYADSHMLKSIIQNLVSNAIKFTPVGGRILITAHHTKKMVEVHVMDNGVGMSDEVRKSLMKDESLTTKGTEKESGTGLGLILVKDFITQNRGTFSIESEKGKGTTAIFTLPTSGEGEVTDC